MCENKKNNNSLICKYMGNVCHECASECDGMSYNRCWDALMPVVLKITNDDWSHIDIGWGTGCTDSFASCKIKWFAHRDYSIRFESSGNSSDEQDLLTTVYENVVEFIKWYNETVKQS